MTTPINLGDGYIPKHLEPKILNAIEMVHDPITGTKIQTFSGRGFDVVNPDPAEIDIRDIAHALANQCRFSGQCKEFYSVAQHSVLCTHPPEISDSLSRMRTMLMHDAIKAAVEGATAHAVKSIESKLAGRAAEFKRLQEAGGRIVASLQKLLDEKTSEVTLEVTKAEPFKVAPPRPAPSTNGQAHHADGVTSRGQRFLNAAATLTSLGTRVDRESVCAWVGLHPRGGSVGEELKALEVAGMITIDRGAITVTDAGMAAAEQLSTADALQSAKAGLSSRQRRLFEAIEAAYPGEISREEIAAKFNLHPRGGSLGEDLGRIVGRGLAESNRGRYKARDFLFAY